MTNAIEKTHNMSQNVTAVKPDQQLALELVLRGLTDGEIANYLNVRRETIWRWRHHDPAFRTVLHEQQSAMLDATVGRLQGMAEQAANVVLSALHSSKAAPKLAMSLLSSLGMFERDRGMGHKRDAPAGTATVREAERENEAERQIAAVEAESEGELLELPAGERGGDRQVRMASKRAKKATSAVMSGD